MLLLANHNLACSSQRSFVLGSYEGDSLGWFSSFFFFLGDSGGRKKTEVKLFGWLYIAQARNKARMSTWFSRASKLKSHLIFFYL